MNRYHNSLLFLIFSLVSCIKPVEIDIPTHEPKLVVNSLFLKGRHIEVNLSYSKHIYDTLTILGGNGVVEITHNNYTERLKYAGEGKYVTQRITTSAGEKYSIKAWLPGLDTVYASDVVPQKIPFELTNFIPNAGMDEEGYPYSEYEITFKDPSGVNNYYEIAKYDSFDEESSWQSGFSSDDPYVLNEGDEQYYYPNILLSDEMFDGKTVKLRLKSFGSLDNNGVYEPIPIQHIYFRSISENYYRYKKKLLRHIDNQYRDLWDGTGNPVLLYTNIENGYGIFAAYAVDSETLNLE